MMRAQFTACFVVGMVALLAIPAVSGTTIFVPSEYENVEAPDGAAGTEPGGIGYPTGYRMQIIVDAGQFASLPASLRTMTGYFMRPDGLIGTAKSASWPHFTLKMSTTDRTPATLNNIFALNIGSDETVVYDGPVTFSTANSGPIGGPKDFDIAFEFQNPFHYDPSKGSLLIDWTVTGPAAWVGHDAIDGASAISTWVFNSNRFASRANNRGSGTAIYKFTFVPEPTTLVLACFSLLGLIVVGRRSGPKR